MRRRLLAAAAAALVVAGLPVSSTSAHPKRDDPRPVVFVHGGAGSALQFQTQAKRLASNGYPADAVEAHDYDSTFTVETTGQIFARLDARITRLLAQTGADRVDLLGHSLGTTMAHAYLATPERAARVAHYVNLDGRTSATPPGGVPTLAVWGEGPTTRAIGGATNVYFNDQSHTQVVTSPQTFVEVYRFFTGRAPRTTAIVPQSPGHVTLAGRAVIFPTNVGVAAGRLEVYEVSHLTGARLHRGPLRVFALSGDGAWGPLRAKGTSRYEFAILRDGAATHHFYVQPSRRTDLLMRLLTGIPGHGLGALIETSDRHTALTISRNKEWWGDQGSGGDALYINGLNILNAANSPRTKRVIGIFAYDGAVDATTDLTAPIPAFFSQIFITGMDVYIPAVPRGVVWVVARSRTGGWDLVSVPNWASSDHRISIQVNDFD